jgi:hypothetical protein
MRTTIESVRPSFALCVAVAAIMLLVVVVGCGGSPGDQEAAPEAATSGRPAGDSDAPDTAASRAVDLDFSEKPAITGYVRFRGGCGGEFPFHFQHPEGWTFTANHLGFFTERDAGPRFGIRVGDDMGSVHVTNQMAMLKQAGARTVGEVRIGGLTVEVIGREEGNYFLFAPHPWGDAAVMYHGLSVGSSLGEAETLRILDSFEPIKGC